MGDKACCRSATGTQHSFLPDLSKSKTKRLCVQLVSIRRIIILYNLILYNLIREGFRLLLYAAQNQFILVHIQLSLDLESSTWFWSYNNRKSCPSSPISYLENDCQKNLISCHSNKKSKQGEFPVSPFIKKLVISMREGATPGRTLPRRSTAFEFLWNVIGNRRTCPSRVSFILCGPRSVFWLSGKNFKIAALSNSEARQLGNVMQKWKACTTNALWKPQKLKQNNVCE